MRQMIRGLIAFFLFYYLSIFSSAAVATYVISTDKNDENILKESPVSIEWDVTLASKYIWQGFDYSNVGRLLQPKAYLMANDFSATIWTDHDVDTHKAEEIDLYLQYDCLLIDYALSIARLFYHDDYYDDSEIPSAELNACTAVNTKSFTISPLAPYISTCENSDFRLLMQFLMYGSFQSISKRIIN